MREVATIYLHVDAFHHNVETSVFIAMPWIQYEHLDKHCLWDDCFQISVINTNCKHRRYYISSEGKVKVLD